LDSPWAIADAIEAIIGLAIRASSLPDDFRRFVDRLHHNGIGVILD
jgi:dsRNA-specific ribonuclease